MNIAINMILDNTIWVLLTLLLAILGITWHHYRQRHQLLLAQWQLQQNLSQTQAQLAQLQQENCQLQQEHKHSQQDSYQQITALKIELAESNTLLQSQQQQFDDKIALLEQAKSSLSLQFQSIATELLAQTGERLAQQQQQGLSHIIDPFKSNLQEFKTRVEQLHHQDTIARTQLSEQVNQLMQASAKVSAEAHALTRAMTGQAKSQGDWGEMLLERLLELAGLIEGQHFETQHHTTDTEGNKQRPDVVLLLPDNKHLIVDSKVSLTAYTRYVNAEQEADQASALQQHLTSLRNHITSLGRKNYPAGKGINSPDFVILFTPIEPALLAAAKADDTIYELAWQHNVLLTSPSTLLFVLRMVGQLWRNAQQQQNIQEIIQRGELLLDKFTGFSEDMEKIGTQLITTQKTWEAAQKKLSGNGGLVSQAHKLAKLGIKPKKPLPAQSNDESDAIPML